MIAARGTSDHAAIFAQYVLGARNGLPVALAAPSLTSVYGRPPRVRNALVIGISQSGRSPDVVAVLADARRQGAITVALTNDPGVRARRRRGAPRGAGGRPGARRRGDEDVRGRGGPARDALVGDLRRCGLVGGAPGAPGGDACGPRGRGRDRRNRRALGTGGPLRRPRPGLPVRDGPGMGAQAQGAGVRPGRPVLGRGLRARSHRAGRGRLSGPRARHRRAAAGGHARPARAAP